MNKIIRIQMETGEIKEEYCSKEEQLLAGRALTSKVISEEVNPHCDVFGSHNKLVLAAGLYAGTTISCGNRLSIGGKSPLTGTIKESNAGGNMAYKMGKLGIRAIIFEGLPPKESLQFLYISEEKMALLPANEYKEMPIYPATKKLRHQFGDKVGISIIGPTGERRSLASGIANTDNEGRPSRYCGRGGLGALMGSKGIKAIVLDDSNAKGVTIENAALLKKTQKQLNKEILNNEALGRFTKYGTAGMVDITNALGALPTHNFSRGAFDLAKAINGNNLHEVITQRGGVGNPSHSCMPGCVIRCSNVYPDDQGKEKVSPLEYETISLLGSNCGIGNLDVIADLNYRCNNLGLDTIDTGGAIALAMEAGVIPFGDELGALNLLNEVEQNTWLGRIIASGGVRTGQILGVRRIPAVKGQIMAAYDPRAIKGLGVTYATSTMGADHTAGQTVRMPIEHHHAKGQVEASQKAQITNTMHDCIGTCLFLNGALANHPEWLSDMITAIHGITCSYEELLSIAKQTLLLERDFNQRAGFSDQDDHLPEFFYIEENPDSKTVFDVSHTEMKKVFDFE
ncbi:aldehyde ferredoxin oxidoreductase C-terminal domain-containing protein [Tindallia californiensis]|uniref:Aldehyde:ferredoxin oxidoreductase n=1 Tax=Tindallia californiensis TaxID=159292 RepID=A0A1H3J0Q4_9FIRM|nr:aldehyde ferredoxin oxidoreductase C-terminal domain-containing protein [Tindallia californiensis]SDY33540.1 aldehyde:ferredoxin oxidoreductase [Tindallia californiensis]